MKILVVNTQSVNHDNATGVTMRSILRAFPQSDILELYMQPCVRARDAFPICSVQLGAREIPIRALANRFFGKAGATPPLASSQDGKVSMRTKLKKRLAMLIDFEKVFLSKRIREILREFKPDCIYTLGNAIDAMKYACAAAEYLKIRILPHFMDNWPQSHRYKANEYPVHMRCTQKWLMRMYKNSNCALAISEKMAEAYEQRTGIPHFALMNAVNVDAFRQDWRHRDTDLLVYAGGLHLNRNRSLLEIAKTVYNLNVTDGKHYALQIYTDRKSRALYEKDFSGLACVSFLDYVKHDDICSVYSHAGILIHIETFDTEYRDFIRYSLSTKISEYLATGLPILLYAPKDICVSAYLQENRAAEVVSDPELLEHSVRRLLYERNYRNLLSENAERLSKEKHDMPVTLSVFENALQSSCKQ